MQEANRDVTAEAEKSHGSRFLPVLARREDEVDETAAADLADLAVQETLFEAAS